MVRNKGIGSAHPAIDGLSRRISRTLNAVTASNTESGEAAMSHAWRSRTSQRGRVLSSSDSLSLASFMLRR